MSKNQSIMSFFGGAKSKKVDESVDQLTKTPEKTKSKILTSEDNKQTDSSKKRSREPKATIVASPKKNNKDGENLVDEKENIECEKKSTNQKKVMSDSDDSPVKRKTPISKRRKVLSSSSSECEVQVEEVKESKSTKKKELTKAAEKETVSKKKKSSKIESESEGEIEVKEAEKETVSKKKKNTKIESESEGEPEVKVAKKEIASKKNKNKKIESESETEPEVKAAVKEKVSSKIETVSKKKKKNSKLESENESESKVAEKNEIEEIKEVPKEIAEKPKNKSPAKPVASFFTKMTKKEVKVDKPEEVKVEKSEEEIKTEIMEIDEKVEVVEDKKSPVKTMMQLTVKKEEKQSDAYCKSTSKFFGGKLNDSANKEAQIAVSASNTANKQDYLPNKENYHPIDDACWSKGQPVPFKAIAMTLYAMEQTTKRLELLSIVCNYFRSVLALTPKDLIPSIYMLTNKVAPDYEGLELGVGDTILFKALAEATGSTLAKLKIEFQNKGDIGLVAEANRCNQKLIFAPKKLTIAGTFNKLREIAQISGNSSGNKKTDVIKGLLVSCDSIEARYLIRAIAGKLRNGLGENSILSALAHACSITPPVKEGEKFVADVFAKQRKAGQIDEIKQELEVAVKHVKHAYNQCPNYQVVVEAIIEDGIENLDKRCKLKPGIPLKPMLANPTKGIHEILKRFENITFTCEYKYDGERAQIHILEDGSCQVFSRNSENNTSKYPDMIQSLQEILNLKTSKKKAVEEEDKPSESAENKKIVTSAILDAEVVAYDLEKKVILPFQVLSTRKRKDANVNEIKVQVCIFAFDLIMLNGQSLIGESFRKRREYLYDYFPYVEAKLMYAVNMNSNDVEKIQEFLDQSIKDGCEGLMVKTLDTEAHYEISKRSYNWLKLKKDYLDGVGDTLDLVVIGGYLGTGKRTGVYGGYLLACYDPENEEYQTICKIGTGFKDEDLQVQFESLSKITMPKKKSYYNVNDSLEQPDHWFEPEQVWEIKCADFSLSPVHTAAIGLVDSNRGMSMRFPRFLRLRDDKNAEQATSSQQVCDMYNNQQQMINVNEKSKKTDDNEDEDDY